MTKYSKRRLKVKISVKNFENLLFLSIFVLLDKGFKNPNCIWSNQDSKCFKRFSTWCHEDQVRRGPRRRPSPSGCQAPESSPRCPLRSEWTRCRIPAQTGIVSYQQRSGSVTFWYRSKDSDPYLWLTNPAPHPILLFSFVTFKMPTKNFSFIFANCVIKSDKK